VDGYTVTYVRPTATASAQKISFGAWLRVASGGHQVAMLHTQYGLYPSTDASQPIGRFFNDNSAESRVGLKAGLTQDIWTVISPNITPLQGLINQGDVTLTKALNQALTQPPAQRAKSLNTLFQLRDFAIRGLTQRYVEHPWAASFKLIVSPLVTWLWLGGILAVIGGLIALWPMPRRTPRRNGSVTRGRRRSETLDETPALPPVRERELV
jgi:cytochrome c-type biogenesis protein CcmF